VGVSIGTGLNRVRRGDLTVDPNDKGKRKGKVREEK